MSKTKAPPFKYVAEIEGLQPTCKLVLFTIAGLADDSSRECCPLVSLIAELCNIGERSVRRHLVTLQQLGYLVVTPRRDEDGANLSNLYTIGGP